MRRFCIRSGILVVLTVFAVACSGPGHSAQDRDAADMDGDPVILSDYEVFDASPYRDSPAQVEIRIQHDVPDELMESRADAGITQIVRGYRVQVFMSLDRDEAVTEEERVRRWLLRTMVEEQDLPEIITIYNLFRQPYYRVRIGDFIRRADAERLMLLMFGRFSGASVVPDLVTIRR